MKRFAITLFTLSLATLLAWAAAQDTASELGFPIVDEPITLTLMGARAGIQGDWSQLRVFQRMEELTNIRLEFITPPTEGYEERKNLTFASGQLPDFFFGGNLTASDEVTYGAQGMLIPLEDLIEEHAPNILRVLEENPEIRRSITAPDSHIYALPNLTAGFGVYPKLWINGVWLERLGLDMPMTTAEFYDVLMAFREGDPNENGQQDEIPLTAMNLDNWPLGDIRPAMLAAFDFSVDYGQSLFDVAGDRVRFVPAEEGFRAYLEYMNRIYDSGLLDRDAFTQSRQQVTAKGQEGRLGAFNHGGPFLVVGPEENDNYPHIYPLVADEGQERIWPVTSNIRRGAFAITSRNPDPVATIRWVDYFFSEEGALLLVYGVEGEDWVRTDEGGLERLTPEGANPEEHRAGQITPDAGSILPLYRQPVFEIAQVGVERTNPANFYIGQETNEKLVPYERPVFPLVYFTNEEQRRLNALLPDIERLVEQHEAQFVTGRQSLDEFEGFVSTLERIGLGEVLEIYQAAYDRWLAAGGAN